MIWSDELEDIDESLGCVFLLRKGGKSMFIHQKKTNIAAWPPFFGGESILLKGPIWIIRFHYCSSISLATVDSNGFSWSLL